MKMYSHKYCDKGREHISNRLCIQNKMCIRDSTDDGSYCYVVSEGRIKRRNLVTGLTGEEYVQILEGLEAGEQVITDPVKTSQEGDRAYGQNAD